MDAFGHLQFLLFMLVSQALSRLRELSLTEQGRKESYQPENGAENVALLPQAKDFESIEKSWES